MCTLVLQSAGQVLQNGGFESGMSHWLCWDCTCHPTDDAHSGQEAVKVTERKHNHDGPTQYVQLASARAYVASAYVKLLNDAPDHSPQELHVQIEYIYSDDSHHYQSAADHTATASDGWVKHSHDGITQYVDLSPGQRYVASAYVKLLNDAADHTTQRIQIEMEYVYEDGTHHYQSAADLRATASDGWVNVTGTLHVPNVERKFRVRHVPLVVLGLQHGFDGPSQYIDFLPGQSYVTSAYFKLLNPPPDNSTQRVHVMIDYKYTDGSHHYVAAAEHPIRMSDGWVHVTGTLAVPNAQIENARVYLQGPVPSVNMLVDDVSVTLVPATETWQRQTDNVINQKRKSDIHFKVTLPAGMSKGDVQIHVLQTKNSFPFGTAVNAGKYNSNAASGKYRDFIHKHFSWAVPESSLKWVPTEPQKGHTNYQPPLDMIHGLRAHGIKVRGHNLVWPSEGNIPAWARALSGDELREAVKHHIEETMNVTRGLLEHWDVVNEALHNHYLTDRLHDPDYNLELFRIAHNADPNVKLFLNDYGVVSGGDADKYLAQTRKFLAANVGLYGIGAQCHFNDNHEPSPYSMKQHLDKLAQPGVPIWITELDVGSTDENVRADYYERALRAAYGHPAVEGILIWGFWDHAHWRSSKAALVTGDDFQITAAGRRVLDLWENQWMTDETHVLSQSGDQFTVHGFHVFIVSVHTVK
nr:hypothetical protein BaRGS_007475 [Batillaria attramentaria]